MSFISLRSLLRSFRYAARGLRSAYQTEQNFRIDIYIALITIALMVYFHVTLGEVIVLSMMMMLVMILELVNTGVEKMIDLFKPRLHYYAEVVKDILAGAVLIASLGALFVGLLIFYPYFIGSK